MRSLSILVRKYDRFGWWEDGHGLKNTVPDPEISLKGESQHRLTHLPSKPFVCSSMLYVLFMVTCNLLWFVCLARGHGVPKDDLA